jgi:hypothetical protein
MTMYELLDARTVENKTKPVWLYDLLEARIKEREQPDTLWKLLSARIKEREQE